MAGLLVIMGSGETAPTMVKPHRSIFERVGDRPAILLDTPYGFQSNADDISARAVGYFAASVGRAVEVLSWRSVPPPGLDRERAVATLRGSGWVFAGPGSPTFALRQWRDTPIQAGLVELLQDDGVVVLASAAALTLGSHTVPVYEIYKAGIDPHWVPGLDLVSAACGLPAVIIPHYDNAEGGHHDTRFCYLGEPRLATMETELPDSAFVLGVDEHTAVLLDLGTRTASVVGNGSMTIRRRGRSVVHPAGSVIEFAHLAEIGTAALHNAASSGGGAPPLAPTGSADPANSPAAGIPSLRAAVAETMERFTGGLAQHRIDSCVEAILELEQALVDWSADTLTSDEGDRARADLRAMVVRLGELADVGARDPRVALAPFVDSLLELRRRARDGRDFATSDWVREQLSAAGVEVRDTPTGAEWHLA